CRGGSSSNSACHWRVYPAGWAPGYNADHKLPCWRRKPRYQSYEWGSAFAAADWQVAAARKLELAHWTGNLSARHRCLNKPPLRSPRPRVLYWRPPIVPLQFFSTLESPVTFHFHSCNEWHATSFRLIT